MRRRRFPAMGVKARLEAHRSAARICVPPAGDDAKALEQAAQLVRDAGQEPPVLASVAAASAKNESARVRP